jgi:hypothetical protein
MPSSYRRLSWFAALPALLSLWPMQALADDELTFRTISRAVVSSNGDRLEFLVARSRADWDRAWRHRGPDPNGAAARYVPAPTLDFAAEMAVGVLGASQLNRCAAITIVRVVHEAARIRVDYEPWHARPEEDCAPEISTPFHVVAIPASPMPVAFVEVAAETGKTKAD